MTRRAAGLDGCRGGWVAVVLAEGEVAGVRVVDDLDAALAWAGAGAVGVDMPVGLLDAPDREADVAARARLPGRAATVFSAPPRVVVEAFATDPRLDHATASALARATTGKGLSQQAWRLVPRVLEVDRAVASGQRLLEVHPEVVFTDLEGGHPPARKTSWAGLARRRARLSDLGVHLPADFEGADRCAPDDVLDAAAVAWVADGAAAGEPLPTLPPSPTQHDRGHPVVIHRRTPPASP